MAAILFSLEDCMKCQQTKKILQEADLDFALIVLPHDISKWSPEQKELAETHNVLEDLSQTAPVLWDQGDKHLGYLRIKKWIQNKSD